MATKSTYVLRTQGSFVVGIQGERVPCLSRRLSFRKGVIGVERRRWAVVVQAIRVEWIDGKSCIGVLPRRAVPYCWIEHTEPLRWRRRASKVTSSRFGGDYVPNLTALYVC